MAPAGAQSSVALTPGTRLGPYEITASLGAGGMGEVYRARDTRLDRDVAIKALPPDFATDQDRVMRFEREAKTLAALNHPNVAQIHGMGSIPGPGTVKANLLQFLPSAEPDAKRAGRT